jgi:hypothetical protein
MIIYIEAYHSYPGGYIFHDTRRVENHPCPLMTSMIIKAILTQLASYLSRDQPLAFDKNDD